MNKKNIKTQPKLIKSGNYLEQALMKGLNKKQKEYAKSKIKHFEDFGLAIPYRLIRKGALEIN